MELLFGFAGSVIDLINALYIAFFVPIKAVPHALFTTFYSGRFPLIEKFFDNLLLTWLFAASGLGEFCLAELLLGSGIAIFVLWRIVVFFRPSITLS